ncbi:MAG: hypothetical protein M0Q38_16350 [Bacteroidales bacterium]|jgi:hypothetical protein|nr:hypothetical protein [Bacteroidales bacterium]
MNRIYPVFIILFFPSANLPAQTPGLILGNAYVCAGQDVLLPVTATGLFNIGAITLFISFDSTRLIYSSLQNVDSQLEGLTARWISSPPQLVITWSNVVGANFPQTKFFDITYHYINGNNDVSFNPGCEIADTSLQVLTISYSSGHVNDGEPIIESQPQNEIVKVGLNAVFQVASPNTTLFHWSESKDNGVTWTFLQDDGIYNGTHGQELTVRGVPVSFNDNLYRCILGEGSCSTFTSSVKLTVDSISSIGDEGRKIFSYLINQPNPFESVTSIDYLLSEEGNVHATVVNGFGQTISDLVSNFQSKGKHELFFNAMEFPSGLYFCRLEFHNTAGKDYSAILKMTKNK